ncbi:hypothetical protein JW916_03075 [Candidatus Sumerlaeota bacterium]|nr:hypothetical protein [Candidatus Sumerlaeota bacterium]
MPIEIRVQRDGDGLVLISSGVLSGRDLIEVHEKMLAAPEIVEKSKYCILDEEAVEAVDISPDHIRTVAEMSKRVSALTPKGTLVCIVAPRDAAFGFARMWEVLAEETSWETMTVRSRAEADSWIRARVKEKFGFDPDEESGES